MEWLKNFKARWQWHWVGTVEGPAIVVDDKGNKKPGGNCTAYWNLYQRGDGKRRTELVGGHFYASQAALTARAKVEAWEVGGPVPPLHASPEPKRTPPKLIVFPGSKL